MLELFITGIIIAFIASIIGHAYVNILSDPEHIFGGWNRFLTYHLIDKREAKGLKRMEWLHKPLIGCSICNTGQWTLWIGLAYFIWMGYEWQTGIIHVFTICLSLILAVTLNRIFDK